jgi:hypothetical protein
MLGSIAVAVAIGAVVSLASRAAGASSCPAVERASFASSCQVLVTSLSVRVGAMAALVALLMDVVGSGLLRTAKLNELIRRTAKKDRAGFG